ncbi:MAG: orotidine-5'-phosphate decarboxylase [Bacteroidia bacterium]
MTRLELFQNILQKKSFLCIGLDTDLQKIPKHLLSSDDAIFEFNKQIIDATQDLCVAYKPNLAFYECLGTQGWQALEKTINYINEKYPDQFTIADAKRGDIGNTSKMYAQAFFEKLNFDSITVAPYMGEDSVTPFLEYKNKWVILLALTSNKGAEDFQKLEVGSGSGSGSSSNETANKQQTTNFLFEIVLQKSQQWSNADNMMYVVGATQASMLSDVRKIVPDHFLLVPGVGAQGGSLQDVAKYGMNKQCGLLVNSSRNIIYAGNDEHFAKAARAEALKMQQEMGELLAHLS